MTDETRKEAVKNAVEVLNRIHKLDPTVLPALIFHRVPCNEALADDPTVQVGPIDNQEGADGWEVGFLGIINGLFGVDDNGMGFIYAYFDDNSNLEFTDKQMDKSYYCERDSGKE